MKNNVFFAGALLSLLLAFAFTFGSGFIPTAYAGTVIITATPSVVNGIVVGFANTIITTGSLSDANSVIVIELANSTNTLKTIEINTTPTFSQNYAFTQCGTSKFVSYGLVSFFATAPPCLDINIQKSLSPTFNSFNYSNSLYGDNIIFGTNAKGFVANVVDNLTFISNYSNTLLGIQVNPPKLSALNYYSNTIKLLCGQNFTDQQLFLQAIAPPCVRINETVNVIPSWTSNQTIAFNSVNAYVNIRMIPKLNITRMALPPSARVFNLTYGINITAMSANNYAVNYTLLNAFNANSPEILNCHDLWRENGTNVCLDNLSLIVVGDVKASHNISGGVTKAFQDFAQQARANYTYEVGQYNSIYVKYEANGDPNNPNSNLSLRTSQLANATTFSKQIENATGYIVGAFAFMGLAFMYAKRKNREGKTAGKAVGLGNVQG